MAVTNAEKAVKFFAKYDKQEKIRKLMDKAKGYGVDHERRGLKRALRGSGITVYETNNWNFKKIKK
jgi:hypothetical protein